MDRSVPIAVSTGSLYPMPTLESIQHLNELGIQDVELTLQSNEFFLTFERKLSMTILPELLRLVQIGMLRVRSVHAPNIPGAHSNNLWARKQYLIHSIETCRLLGATILVIHPLHLLVDQESALSYLSVNGTSLQSVLMPGMHEIIEQAHSANVTLAMENIQDWLDEIFFNAPTSMLCFLRDLDHPAVGCTFDLMHAQVPGVLDDFMALLSADIVNIHASDLLPPLKRVAVGKGAIDWNRLSPKLQALPRLRQITVELSKPQDGEITESVKLLSDLMTSSAMYPASRKL
jgi:sugar phosphate isomerase/epimerase